MSKRDFYEVLSISKTATPDEIKKAYRKKALEFHPDRNKAADAETKFKEVNEAYEVLSNPDKRKTYDQFGHAAFDPTQGGGFGGAGRGGNPFTYTYSYGGGQQNPFGDFDFSDPFEIFESFFGGGFAQQKAKPRYSLAIDLIEAVKGTRRSIVHQGKSHTVNIPAGADEGTRIRFSDFDVTIDVKPHPEFKREGYDIITVVNIPFTLAALGGEIEVNTIDKPVKLKIRTGTQPGSMFRLKGVGVPYLRGNGRGDHYIRLNITVPTSLTREQKNLLKQLDKTLS